MSEEKLSGNLEVNIGADEAQTKLRARALT